MKLYWCRPLAIVCLSTALVQCEKPGGMGDQLDPDPILGCYKSAAFNDDTITITPDDIRLNGDTIYSRYEYGTTRGGQRPYIYGYPRGYLWSDEGKLRFGISDEGSGATLTTDERVGKKTLSLVVFPTSDVGDYKAGPVMVTFSETDCPSATVSTISD